MWFFFFRVHGWSWLNLDRWSDWDFWIMIRRPRETAREWGTVKWKLFSGNHGSWGNEYIQGRVLSTHRILRYKWKEFFRFARFNELVKVLVASLYMLKKETNEESQVFSFSQAAKIRSREARKKMYPKRDQERRPWGDLSSVKVTG